MNIDELDDQEKTELSAAVAYVRNQSMDDDFNFFLIPEKKDTAVDIIYEPKDIKFQVVSIKGEPNRLLSKGSVSFQYKLTEIFEIFIEEPIKIKIKKYRGSGVSDIILIIHGLGKPGIDGMIEKEIIEREEEIDTLGEESGFKAIYIAFDMHKELVQVYKRADAV